MTKEKKELYESYQSIPPRSRFWLHSEACYTEHELNQRIWILKTRSNSEINPDYLINPSSWFADDSQAFVNVYERSWFYSTAFKTRHILIPDDFHVQPIDSQRLQWPALYDLMQKTGDYLLVRNQKLRPEHLNQPINFFLLDLNNILKGISQNPNIKQTQEQLEHLSRYVRTVEKNISPFVGSDRLFLANFRGFIDDEVHPQLTRMIESQLLSDRLSELSKTIKQLSMERNRILHFALNINPVNPHSYTFAIGKPDDLTAYPTQAIKDCGTSSTEIMNSAMSVLKLTIEQLKECHNFKLISMQDNILEHYAQAVSDLNELEQFQKVISQTIELLGQAGEVYTVYQFKEQLSLLLKQIEYFIDESSVHIEEIIHANTHAYHKAIQEEQKSSFFTKLLSFERDKLKTFIRNQDTLAQFPSTTADLAKTRRFLKEHVTQVLAHLDGSKIKKTDFASIAGKAQELNALMHSMYRWVKVQHEIKGLEPPKKPEKLKFLLRTKPKSTSPFFDEKPSFIDKSQKFNLTYKPAISPNYLLTQAPALEASSQNENVQLKPTNNSFYLGALAFLPFGLLLLYLLYKAYETQNKSEVKIKVLGTKKEYEVLTTKIDDLFIEIQKTKDRDDAERETRCEDFIETYKILNKKAQRGRYDVDELNELYEDMHYFYKDHQQDAMSLSEFVTST